MSILAKNHYRPFSTEAFNIFFMLKNNVHYAAIMLDASTLRLEYYVHNYARLICGWLRKMNRILRCD